MTGGVFDPMGVVRSKKTVGFNYPPLKPNKYLQGNILFYKTDGFKNQNNVNFNQNAKKFNSTAISPNNHQPLPEMGTQSEASSISK